MADTSPAAVIEASNLSRSYGDRRALNQFSLNVPSGTVFGLLGPNGSGKSTFLALVAAMERPAEGELRVFGNPPAAAAKGRVGMVFQENAQDPSMTCIELLSLAGRMQGLGGANLRARAVELLATFGLADRARDPIAKLSGGMRRRLEVARALVHDPELVLLDEPTTGIDPDERRNLWSALLGSARKSRTILLATNDLSEADAVCEQVAFIREGSLVASGTPAELKAGLRRESVTVELAGDSANDLSRLASLAGAGDVILDGETVRITCDDSAALIPKLFELVPGRIRSVNVRPSTLEDAYFRHIGRRLAQPADVAS